MAFAADQAEGEAEQPGGGERDAGQVQTGGRSVCLGEAAQCHRDGDDSDRHVHPEDPLPGGTLGDRAADEWADRDGEAGDRAPHAEGRAASFGRDGRGQDGEGQRQDERGPESLDGPRCDEDPDGWGEGGGCATQSEDREAGDEDTAATQPVAEGCADEQHDGERQRVGVHRPLQALEPGAEVGPDLGEREGHHQVVQGNHERG